MEEDFIEKFHSYHDNELSYKHYPSVPASDFQSHKKERLGSHSDGSSLTLLFQDDCGGLEVETPGRRGEFFPATPIDGTLVMNIGDILMRWSNGTLLPFPTARERFRPSVQDFDSWLDFLLSTVHRVQPPPLRDHWSGGTSLTRERYSIPYFVQPMCETTVECLPGCYDEKNPAKYSPRAFKDLSFDYGKLFYPDP